MLGTVLSGDLIVQARRRAGLTQRELAARIGRPQATVARWERGHNRPSLEATRAVLNSVGLELSVGITRCDDSYNALIKRQLRLAPAQRVRSMLAGEAFDPAAVLAALARHGVRHVVIGEVAAALHGSPLSLARRELALTPASGQDEPLGGALRELGAESGDVDDHFRGVHTIAPWRLPDGSDVHLVDRPAGTRGYGDLIRDAAPTEVANGLEVPVASLIDLARIAEASPRAGDRAGRTALRAVREITSGHQRPTPSPEDQIAQWMSPSLT